jgi:hypothetical protein
MLEMVMKKSTAVANAIATFALFVSIASAWFTYSQWHESATPNVDIYTETDPDEQNLGVEILNSGPGVAEVQDVSYFVDRKRLADIKAAEEKFGSVGVSVVEWYPGNHIPLNEKSWIFRVSKRDATAKEYEATADFLQHHFAVQIRYCSVHHECRIACTKPNMCSNESQ